MTPYSIRYVTVCRPLGVAVKVASLPRARLAVALVIVGSVVLCSPNYLLYAPVPLGDRPGFWINYNQLIQPVHMVSAMQLVCLLRALFYRKNFCRPNVSRLFPRCTT